MKKCSNLNNFCQHSFIYLSYLFVCFLDFFLIKLGVFLFKWWLFLFFLLFLLFGVGFFIFFFVFVKSEIKINSFILLEMLNYYYV